MDIYLLKDIAPHDNLPRRMACAIWQAAAFSTSICVTVTMYGKIVPFLALVIQQPSVSAMSVPGALAIDIEPGNVLY
jgi:hypothetical protein